MATQFRNFISLGLMSGYRQLKDGKYIPPGFASKDDVLFFYPDAEFLPDVYGDNVTSNLTPN